MAWSHSNRDVYLVAIGRQVKGKDLLEENVFIIRTKKIMQLWVLRKFTSVPGHEHEPLDFTLVKRS